MENYRSEEKNNKDIQQRAQFYHDMGERIRTVRKAASMSQGDLSEKTDISKAPISGIENGRPTEIYNLFLLADALHTSVGSLLYDKKEVSNTVILELMQEIQTLPAEQQKFLFRMLESMLKEMKSI